MPPVMLPRYVAASVASCWLLSTGCSDPDSPSQEDAVLIRTDQQTVTRAQFERAFEAARIAYSDDRSVDPVTMKMPGCAC
jgi:hypothetical protein